MDKELLLFPLFSGFCCLLVMASFMVPAFASEDLRAMLENGEAQNNPLVWVMTFLFYFLNYFVIVFFNSALVACAIIRFRGGDPTVSDGLRAATKRLPVIFGWALVSATVGLLLKVIESRNEKIGSIVSMILGAGWTIATYFCRPGVGRRKCRTPRCRQTILGSDEENLGRIDRSKFWSRLYGFSRHIGLHGSSVWWSLVDHSRDCASGNYCRGARNGGIDGGLSGVIRFEYDYSGSAVSVRFRSRSSSAF